MIDTGTVRKRILIVDDEPAVRLLCQRVLAGEGFEVDIVSDGRAAQAMISEREYHLYLLDIRMPLMNGRELYEWLQESYPHRARSTMFITGSAMGKDTESFLQGSGRRVLLKPFTTEELKTVVNEALEEKNK